MGRAQIVVKLVLAAMRQSCSRVLHLLLPGRLREDHHFNTIDPLLCQGQGRREVDAMMYNRRLEGVDEICPGLDVDTYGFGLWNESSARQVSSSYHHC